MKPLLSVGIIFKNEIRCLERCLKALLPLKEAMPCEIIMADTGSDDGSREIAEKYADEVFDFPWIDDFSAARNAVMDKCTGKWYLSVDADEVLGDIGELVAFLHSEAVDKASVSYLTIHNYTDPEDKSKFVSNQALRLVNLSTGARYVGKIHEKIQMEKGFAVCNLTHTQLWHDGYLQQKGKEHQKKIRNLPLIEEALKEKPEDPVLLMQALESSYTKDQAVGYANRIISLIHGGKNSRPALEPVLYRDAIKIACVYGMPQYDAWIKEAVKKHPDSPYVRIDVNYYAASMALRTGDFRGMGQYSKVYLDSVERFETHPEEFVLNMGAVWNTTSNYVETVSLIRAYYLAHDEKWKACRKILIDHPLKQVEPQNVMLWLGLVFNHCANMDLTEVFRQVGHDFFDQPAMEQRDLEKMKIFMNACGQMFAKEYDDTPFYLVEALGDCEMAYWAKVMTARDADGMKKAAAKIAIWKAVPPLVLKRLVDNKVELPEACRQQIPDRLAELEK